MGWSVGYDDNWKRDVGYGVPAMCDHPDCNERIDRGISYVCGGQPYGGERGCGLFFCSSHLYYHARLPVLCSRCEDRRKPFLAKPDLPEWMEWKLTHPSWAQWREENPAEVASITAALALVRNNQSGAGVS